MKLTRLKIAGFKSFVDPTDVLIEPGLTGVVGPNGCGKSNLVEALRWVMGESSHKSLRASGMDDVIFAGAAGRPARNTAEVMLVVDNAGRTAPAAFNDADVLEVSRRIEREEGSTYKINGREVRARDVQLLFADAATGARSPAMVRQGQIGEIIAAKPQARRRILEDAAGIAGLNSRRHEAELRLRGTEDNLLRLEDVLHEIEAQVDNLRRQSRQAVRYRNLSGEIRRLDALLMLIGYRAARDQLATAERTLEQHVRAVADRTAVQAEAAKEQALVAATLPGLRQDEAAGAAGLQRLTLARNELDAEERRTQQRSAELVRRIAEIEKDVARENAQARDAAATLERLTDEVEALGDDEDTADLTFAAKAGVADADGTLAEAEAALAETQTQLANLNASRAALERAQAEATERAQRLEAERAGLEGQLAALDESDGALVELDELRETTTLAEDSSLAAEERAAEARGGVAAARDGEAQARARATEAEKAAQKLETEARTVAKLFAPPPGRRFAAVLDEIRVAKGYETALGAALGEDLDASADPSAPVHWSATAAGGDPPLPGGAVALLDFVVAPPALARRLAQIGVVDRAAGLALRAGLAPGQRLVSMEGDLWRWDGFTAAADAPSAAARRLAERNRLAELDAAAETARQAAEQARAGLDTALAAVRRATQEEAATIELSRSTRRAFDQARDALAQAERRAGEAASRRAGLAEALSRTGIAANEAAAKGEQTRAALAALSAPAKLESKLGHERIKVAERRTAAAEARAALQNLLREAEMRVQRRNGLIRDIAAWRERAGRAETGRADLERRLEAARDEQDVLAEAPDTFGLRRRDLEAEIEAAEGRRRGAADALAAAEAALANADRSAREALTGLSEAREARAAAEARLEAARTKLRELIQAITDSIGVAPEALHEQAGLKAGDDLPDAAATEQRLAALKGDRERLGGVNLRAEEELVEVEGKHDALVAERDDLTEAIRRLRTAIGNLNREGRERLLAAFEVVNGHFQSLFTTLFGGGTAELSLIEADDPLEAGLEIIARPPGKKPQVMTLMSGGEQALTATALIFAVFLTNPSPICVLDEVDAPLDDANVERYCDLLQEMVRRSETRFVVITHNPITMARMDRLFGVTMAERGVSQVVSVDLREAEALQEAV
ncbi:chromosome segregation SMC family protein [Chelatococcus reniformis]|uniref:Chromosome partition protein Smc n=1 Tax=Chelatococcus reniformis TaxID=1494448 RepID=A0A916U8P8_9HYPH|nr:AAA family ATPase [Chelatococcus reniformis]GGC62720.1 chromosome partition protein Smc [Chelatococcus reniformis]